MSKARKILLIAFVVVLLVLITTFVYLHFFELNNKEVRRLIQEEASKWPGSEAEAYSIINDGVKNIQNDWRLMSQVRKVAATTGIPKEKAIVDAAVKQCFAYGYFKEV